MKVFFIVLFSLLIFFSPILFIYLFICTVSVWEVKFPYNSPYSALVSRRSLVSQQCSCYCWVVLTQHKICLPRPVGWGWTRGDITRTYDLNWPKSTRYHYITYGITPSNKSWERGRGDSHWSSQKNCYLYWGSASQDMAEHHLLMGYRE